MKVLVFARYIRDKEDRSVQKINGLKKVLGDVFYSSSLKGEKYFFSSAFSNHKNKPVKELKFISSNKVQIIVSTNLKVHFKNLLIFLTNLGNIGIAKELIIKNIMLQYAVKNIKKINPDIVHLHDLLSELHAEILKYCINHNIKCILTLHLYFSKKSDLKEGKKTQPIRDMVFMLPDISKLYITSVSSGIKFKLLNDYPNLYPKQVKTILNGTDFKVTKNTLNIREHYGVPHNKKILICIGNLLVTRKNQTQLLRALTLMNEVEKEDLLVFIIGGDRLNVKTRFLEFCKKNGISKLVSYIGPVPTSEIHNYYAQSDFVISTSLNEAFGLTFIEGFVYGLPAITFPDLDAIDDLFDDKVMLLAKDRTDEALKEAILTATHKTWDKDYIKEYAKRFSVENMVKGYNNLYQSILNQ